MIDAVQPAGGVRRRELVGQSGGYRMRDERKIEVERVSGQRGEPSGSRRAMADGRKGPDHTADGSERVSFTPGGYDNAGDGI
jgi:hypothetical protein